MARGGGSPDVGRLVEHLFRHGGARMVATLTRVLGPEHLELAEEVVQDAMLKALQQWPFRGVPENPHGWLVQVARNRAIDALRRRGLHDRRAPEIAHALLREPQLDAAFASELTDDQLCMMFMCCHPLLSPDARTALTLNVVAGFSAKEVARAFLLDERTAAQRLVRAKRALRAERVSFEMPSGADVALRLDAVLEVIYLLFNEGYSAHGGDELVRGELCAEAVRLGRVLATHALADVPKVHALVALMLFQAARLPARVDAAGDLQLLEEQDRGKWDRRLVAGGFHHLARASAGGELTVYHVQAAIASCHARAASFDDTDWPRIMSLYEQLLDMQPTPVVRLNHAVAVAMVQGAAGGLALAEPLTAEPALARYPLLPATLAELHRRAGNASAAAAQLRSALQLPCTAVERRCLERRLDALPTRRAAHG